MPATRLAALSRRQLMLNGGLIVAIVVALPWALVEFWLFISPGLYPRERLMAIPFALAATFFFFVDQIIGFGMQWILKLTNAG